MISSGWYIEPRGPASVCEGGLDKGPKEQAVLAARQHLESDMSHPIGDIPPLSHQLHGL